MSEKDFDQAMEEAEDAVLSRLIKNEGLPPRNLAEDIVEELFISRPELVTRLAYPAPKRWWYWPREQISDDTPWFFRGSDEYMNPTVCVRIPGAGVVIVATSVPLRRVFHTLNEDRIDD